MSNESITLSEDLVSDETATNQEIVDRGLDSQKLSMEEIETLKKDKSDGMVPAHALMDKLKMLMCSFSDVLGNHTVFGAEQCLF